MISLFKNATDYFISLCSRSCPFMVEWNINEFNSMHVLVLILKVSYSSLSMTHLTKVIGGRYIPYEEKTWKEYFDVWAYTNARNRMLWSGQSVKWCRLARATRSCLPLPVDLTMLCCQTADSLRRFLRSSSPEAIKQKTDNIVGCFLCWQYTSQKV